ncbi:hypothetical protein PCE1_003079 [Barthelona sp. PCE]
MNDLPDQVKKTDQYVLDYLNFRNFADCAEIFSRRMKNPHDMNNYGYNAEFIVDTLMGYVENLQLQALVDLFDILHNSIFSSMLISTSLSDISTYRTDLLKIYLIECYKQKKNDLINDFFEEELNENDFFEENWMNWSSLIYINNPKDISIFSLYFTENFLKNYWNNLRNFLELCISNTNLPTLLNISKFIQENNLLIAEKTTLKKKLDIQMKVLYDYQMKFNQVNQMLTKSLNSSNLQEVQTYLLQLRRKMNSTMQNAEDVEHDSFILNTSELNTGKTRARGFGFMDFTFSGELLGLATDTSQIIAFHYISRRSKNAQLNVAWRFNCPGAVTGLRFTHVSNKHILLIGTMTCGLYGIENGIVLFNVVPSAVSFERKASGDLVRSTPVVHELTTAFNVFYGTNRRLAVVGWKKTNPFTMKPSSTINFYKFTSLMASSQTKFTSTEEFLTITNTLVTDITTNNNATLVWITLTTGHLICISIVFLDMLPEDTLTFSSIVIDDERDIVIHYPDCLKVLLLESVLVSEHAVLEMVLPFDETHLILRDACDSIFSINLTGIYEPLLLYTDPSYELLENEDHDFSILLFEIIQSRRLVLSKTGKYLIFKQREPCLIMFSLSKWKELNSSTQRRHVLQECVTALTWHPSLNEIILADQSRSLYRLELNEKYI